MKPTVSSSARQEQAAKMMEDLLLGVGQHRGQSSKGGPRAVPLLSTGTTESIRQCSLAAAETAVKGWPSSTAPLEDLPWLKAVRTQHELATAREQLRPSALPQVSVPSPVLEPSRGPFLGDSFDLGAPTVMAQQQVPQRPSRRPGYESAPIRMITERKEYEAFTLWD